MKSRLSCVLKRMAGWLLTLLFGVGVLLFWGRAYPAHVAYQEQFQLFLSGADYWWERVSVPGGVADYAGEFLTQFFYYPWAGACILAVLFMLLQGLTWGLARRWGASREWYPLSFLPVLFLWRFMCDESVLTGYAVAWLLVLAAAHLYECLRGRTVRLAGAFVLIPVLYWLAGGVHLVFAGWVVVSGWRGARHGRAWTGVLVSVVLLAWALAGPLLAGLWVQYPLSRLLTGINYYRFPAVLPWMEVGVAAVFWLVPGGLPWLPAAVRRRRVCLAVQVVVLAWGGYYWVRGGCDWAKEELMRYDQLVRNGFWDDVIRLAEQKNPDSPFGVTCLNLALSMKGQMADRMFEFYQNGTEGLLPVFIRDFNAPLPTAEVYYRLGMVNTAQRFTFEAMEAIPNFRKSGRCFKRLAETNLINGQYDVAAKYLRILQRTWAYRDWADDAMTYLREEEKIDAHPEWGWLRQARYVDDFLYSEVEQDIMLGLLYEHNHRNRMAFEYMLAYVLQRRDLERFMKYYPLGKDAGYDHIPRSYQEALVYVWTQSHSSYRGMPWSIWPQVARNMAEFARIYTTQPGARQSLKTRFGDTYWSYLLLH